MAKLDVAASGNADGAIVFGHKATNESAGDSPGSIVIGDSAELDAGSDGTGAVVIGKNADVTGDDVAGNIALGANTSASGSRTSAIGEGATSTEDDTIELGTDADTIHIPGSLVVDGTITPFPTGGGSSYEDVASSAVIINNADTEEIVIDLSVATTSPGDINSGQRVRSGGSMSNGTLAPTTVTFRWYWNEVDPGSLCFESAPIALAASGDWSWQLDWDQFFYNLTDNNVSQIRLFQTANLTSQLDLAVSLFLFGIPGLPVDNPFNLIMTIQFGDADATIELRCIYATVERVGPPA